jgi:hypothetical protein
MIALLQSVDREQFDLARIATDGAIVPITRAMSPEEIHNRLPQLLTDADAHRAGVGIRPISGGGQDEPTLITLDRLTPENMRRIRQRAFMTLEIEPEIYQCWVALDTKSVRANTVSGGMLAQMAGNSVANRFFRLAGSTVARPGLSSPIAPDSRVRLIEGTVGLLNTAMQVEKDIDLFRHQSSL